MRVISGADLANRIQTLENGCPQCRMRFDFLTGLKTKRDVGIEENVLMCPRCECVYAVEVGFGGFRFVKEVTEEYAERLGKQRCGECAGSGKRPILFRIIKGTCRRCGGSGWAQKR
jgi:hypothetical protein